MPFPNAAKSAHALMICGIVTLAGCFGGTEGGPILPMQMPVTYVDQQAPNGVDLALGAQGYIGVCANLTNPNDRSVLFSAWAEYYRAGSVLGESGLQLVDKQGPYIVDTAAPGQDSQGIGGFHTVYANETANGSTQYAIRFVAEVMRSTSLTAHFSPPLLTEKWVNVSFTPYSSGTLHHDGGQCGGI